MRTSGRTTVSLGAAALLLGIAALAAPQAIAGPLADYTGYTRPGYPPQGAKGKPVAAPKAALAFGATVYYMVLDRQAEGHSGAEGDTWGTGIAGFDRMFMAGRGMDRSKLDTSARYLYLYQVVNDSKREAALKDVSIRIIVPVENITSWGHFAERSRTGTGLRVKGVGFAGRAEKGEGIVEASTDTPLVTNRLYRSPAAAIPAERTYTFASIFIGDNVPAAEEKKDMGREPTSVTLVANAERSNLRSRLDSARVVPLPLLGETDPLDDSRDRDRLRDGPRERSAFLRAAWADERVNPRQRSTVFGFTSNLGPTIEDAVVTGRPLAIGLSGAAEDAGVVSPSVGEGGVLGVTGAAAEAQALASGIIPVAGALPTPAPATPPPTPRGGGFEVGPAFGGLGGLPGGVGGMGGLPVAGGLGAYSRPAVSNGGGGIGGGFGGGNGEGQGQGQTDQGQDTAQAERQAQAQGAILNNNISISVKQSQQQQQQQQQQQSQKGDCGCNPHGNVVPIPPAWLLGLLGLPAFLFMGRKKPTDPGAADSGTGIPTA